MMKNRRFKEDYTFFEYLYNYYFCCCCCFLPFGRARARAILFAGRITIKTIINVFANQVTVGYSAKQVGFYHYLSIFSW